jgi:acyl-CoA thioester hydrolase
MSVCGAYSPRLTLLGGVRMKDQAVTRMRSEHRHWQGDHQQTLEDLGRIGRPIEGCGDTLEAHHVEKTKSRRGAIDDTDVVATTFRVRYAETDQMGIVHHASYVVWMEEGRSQWMRAHGNSYAQFEEEGLLLVVSELYLRYKQPARYDQRVTVRCWVESVRSRQIQFNYEVVDAQTGEVFVNAYTQHICLDREGKVTKIPDEWQISLRQSATAMLNVSEHT